MLNTSTAQIKKILLLQFVASLLAGLLSLVFGPLLSLSIFTGSIIASLTNGYFAWKVFFKKNTAQNEAESAKILVTYYGAEVGKIILTVMLFVTAFATIKQLNVIAFMCAYLFTTMIPWLASFFINDDNTNWRDDNV